jgi:DNA-binding MarR family transcriptional regulator
MDPLMNRLRTFNFLIGQVNRLFVRHFEDRAKHLGVTLMQCRVLSVLGRNEGISQVRLAELTETDPMTLVRILDKMEKDDWIERRPDPSDRRVRRIHLKTSAARILDMIWQIGDQARSEALAGFDQAEQDQLTALLTRVHANLQAMLPTGAEAVPPGSQVQHELPINNAVGAKARQ